MQNQTSLDAQAASSQHAVLSGRKAEGFRCTIRQMASRTARYS